MTQEFIGPGAGANGAVPRMTPASPMSQVPNLAQPQYTLRQDYPNSYVNRAQVNKAVRVTKSTAFTITANTPTKLVDYNPNRVAILVSHDNQGDYFLNNDSTVDYSNANVIVGIYRSPYLLTSEVFGNIIMFPWWVKSPNTQGKMGIVEVIIEPYDIRVTGNLFP